MKIIYLDNAATTPVAKEVLMAMKPYFDIKYGNASEYHVKGQEARAGIEKSRNIVAGFLGAKDNEVFFTSGATESINLAHKGLIEAVSDHEEDWVPHVITTAIEHQAVLKSLGHLFNQGKISLTIIPVDKQGNVEVGNIKKAVKKETVLVSVMYVNNEVGTIEPIRKIGLYLKKLNQSRKQKIYFHTDATQAMQYLNCRVDWLGIDFLSFSGHKIYAPKGIGALYVRTGTPLIRQNDGGNQEHGLRSGTENVPYIVALGKAVEIINRSKKAETVRIRKLQKILIRDFTISMKGINLTGDLRNRVPHIVSLVVEGAEGEAMVLRLSAAGIFCSSGSACSASDLSASHVLTAMGYPEEISHGSIRFSLGISTTKKDIEILLEKFSRIVSLLRQMAPNL